MQNILKTFNKEVADRLVENGFIYINETINGQTVYGFLKTDDLTNFIIRHFTENEFYIENVLRY